MKQVVYVDVLLFLNLFVNFFLLLCAGALAQTVTKRLRLLLAAMLGAVYSLVIFLPPMPAAVSVLMNLAFSLVLVRTAFAWRGVRRFLRLFGCFFAANFAFAGIMLAIWLAFKPNGMLYQSGAVYFPISFPVLTVSTIACYLVMKGIALLLRRNAPQNHVYWVSVGIHGKTVRTQALLDTGNGLSDTFSATPVVILEYAQAKPLFDEPVLAFFHGGLQIPQDISPAWQGRLRVIPYHHVQNAGLLPAFRPDFLLIEGIGGKREYRQVYIAVCLNRLSGGRYGALLPPMLLEHEEKWGGKQNDQKDQAVAAPDTGALGKALLPSGRR